MKTYRIKTNNQELLIRKQNESDATSKWIEWEKTRPMHDLVYKWKKKSNKEMKQPLDTFW